jgi:hypothetical protein
MGWFSRTHPPSALQACVDPCLAEKAKNDSLKSAARQRSRALAPMPRTSARLTPCQVTARGIPAITDRFERYTNALPGARAARDLNELADRDNAEVTQPCLERLSLDAATLNRQLGIDPNSQIAIKSLDLRDDTTGYRSAVYRSKLDGKLIVVSRDTQPPSLVDWKTNIFNGEGQDTPQYKSARGLATKLSGSGQSCDIAGYSKGGGLAQQMGLVSPNSNVYIFNSAGVHQNSLTDTGQRNFDSLVNRTTAFSAEQDFMTYMNNATDPEQQIVNAQFLRDHLAGTASGVNPMKIKYESPANRNQSDPRFLAARTEFLNTLDAKIAAKADAPNAPPLFPPIRARSLDVIPNSMSPEGFLLGARMDGPHLGKLAQHQLKNVVGSGPRDLGPMEKQIAADRKTMEAFLEKCG